MIMFKLFWSNEQCRNILYYHLIGLEWRSYFIRIVLPTICPKSKLKSRESSNQQVMYPLSTTKYLIHNWSSNNIPGSRKTPAYYEVVWILSYLLRQSQLDICLLRSAPLIHFIHVMFPSRPCLQSKTMSLVPHHCMVWDSRPGLYMCCNQ